MMLCEICKEQIATIHYTEVLPNSEPKKMALCDACAKQKNLPVATHFSVADILKGLTQAVQAEEEGSTAKCPRCGLTFARFRKGGRLGCATCYDAFQPKIQSILEEIHRDKQHVGKVPKCIAQQSGPAAELVQLHQELKEAVDKEEFEQAAILRDRIQALKTETTSGKGKE
jgi:protein arginine kinase activator